MTIKELRTSAGMTQQEFAEYFTIPKRTVENWEQGISKPSDSFKKLIEYKLTKEGLLIKSE